MWNVKYLRCLKHRSSRPGVFCKKGVLRNFTKFTVKHLCQSLFFNKVAGLRQGLFFNKVAGLRPATVLKKRLRHRCFPVNFVKFLRTPFLNNTSGGYFWKHNVAMQTTAEFASNSTANIKRSNSLDLTFKNVAAKNLCGGVVARKVPRKLTCYSWFYDFVGCKTQISRALGRSPGRFTWKT